MGQGKLLLFGVATGTQPCTERGDREDSTGQTSQDESRIFGGVLTTALRARWESYDQGDRKRNRKDGFLH